MSKGYLIAHIKVHDKEKFSEFATMAMQVISEYGGKLLVRNPTPEVRGGREAQEYQLLLNSRVLKAPGNSTNLRNILKQKQFVN